MLTKLGDKTAVVFSLCVRIPFDAPNSKLNYFSGISSGTARVGVEDRPATYRCLLGRFLSINNVIGWTVICLKSI